MESETLVAATQLRAAVSSGDDSAVTKILKKEQASATNLHLILNNNNSSSLNNTSGTGSNENVDVSSKKSSAAGAAASTGSMVALAVESGKTAVLKALLPFKPDLNIPDATGATPLSQAALDGQIEMCEMLLQAGADVMRRDKEFRTPAHCLLLSKAAADGSQSRNELAVVHILKMMLDQDLPVNECACGWTLLHLACLNGLRSIAKFLIEERGAHIDILNDKGETCLHAAMRRGDMQLVNLLLDHGANVSIRGENGIPKDVAKDVPTVIQYQELLLRKMETPGADLGFGCTPRTRVELSREKQKRMPLPALPPGDNKPPVSSSLATTTTSTTRKGSKLKNSKEKEKATATTRKKPRRPRSVDIAGLLGSSSSKAKEEKKSGKKKPEMEAIAEQQAAEPESDKEKESGKGSRIGNDKEKEKEKEKKEKSLAAKSGDMLPRQLITKRMPADPMGSFKLKVREGGRSAEITGTAIPRASSVLEEPTPRGDALLQRVNRANGGESGASSKESSVGAAGGEEQRKRTSTKMDGALLQSLEPVLAAITKASLRDKEIWDMAPGSPVLPILAENKAMLMNHTGAGKCVVLFRFPRYPYFHGVTSRMYKVNPKQNVRKLVNSILNKFPDVRDPSKFTLSTVGGLLFSDTDSLAGYGFGTLLEEWELLIVMRNVAPPPRLDQLARNKAAEPKEPVAPTATTPVGATKPPDASDGASSSALQKVETKVNETEASLQKLISMMAEGEGGRKADEQARDQLQNEVEQLKRNSSVNTDMLKGIKDDMAQLRKVTTDSERESKQLREMVDALTTRMNEAPPSKSKSATVKGLSEDKLQRLVKDSESKCLQEVAKVRTEKEELAKEFQGHKKHIGEWIGSSGRSLEEVIAEKVSVLVKAQMLQFEKRMEESFQNILRKEREQHATRIAELERDRDEQAELMKQLSDRLASIESHDPDLLDDEVLDLEEVTTAPSGGYDPVDYGIEEEEDGKEALLLRGLQRRFSTYQPINEVEEIEELS